MDWTTIIAVGVLAVVLLAGPSKIPELARALGKAKRSFENASKGIEEIEINSPLLKTAHDLGITTKGLTKEEIASQIASKS